VYESFLSPATRNARPLFKSFVLGFGSAINTEYVTLKTTSSFAAPKPVSVIL